MQIEPNKYVKELTQAKYKYGFTTDAVSYTHLRAPRD